MIDDLLNINTNDSFDLLDQKIASDQLKKHLYFDQYKPNPKQLAFHATGLLAKERAFFAGNRCGKSMWAAAEWCMRLTSNYPDWLP